MAPRSLTSAEVHVWTIPLDLSDATLAPLAEHLSPDETARAQRFVFERHQRRFTAGRGALRAILGTYLGLPPTAFRFDYGPHGKPSLAGPEAERGLRFNISHSQGLALLAVTRARELGVDVEEIRPLPDAGPIAERCFSADENRALRRLPASARLAGFFNCWTRKEAYLKALGDGLARPLDGFDVTLGPLEPARLLRVADDPGEAARWSLRALAPADGYVGAVAVEGEGWRLESLSWQAALAGEAQTGERHCREGGAGGGERPVHEGAGA